MKKKKENKREKGLVPSEKAAEDFGGGFTIYDYEQKYVKRQNVRGAKLVLGVAAGIIGVFLFVLLALLALRVYDLNEYAGYAAMGVCLLVWILVFVVPLVKILRTGYFITNVNAFTAKKAQRHNRKLRRDIADKIIDLTAKVQGVGWYDSEVVGRLAIAVKTADDEKIKGCLTELYKGSVKKSARAVIFKSAMKSAAFSAISQAKMVDAGLIAVVNLQLIKDLVFLYGFRPSDAKLMKIFIAVVRNSLVAYGLGSVNVGGTVVKTMGDAVRGIPILGAAISSIIDSSVQGLTNGALTAVIGYQTIRYLNTEYRLQDILDGIEIEEAEAEVEQTCADLEAELKGKKKKPAVA